MATDGALLRAWTRTRDEDAFAELVRRHGGVAYAAALGVLGGGGPVGPEDVAQAVFLALARRADRFDPAASVASWVYCVARRTALNARAREKTAAALVRQVDELRDARNARSAVPADASALCAGPDGTDGLRAAESVGLKTPTPIPTPPEALEHKLH